MLKCLRVWVVQREFRCGGSYPDGPAILVTVVVRQCKLPPPRPILVRHPLDILNACPYGTPNQFENEPSERDHIGATSTAFDTSLSLEWGYDKIMADFCPKPAACR